MQNSNVTEHCSLTQTIHVLFLYYKPDFLIKICSGSMAKWKFSVFTTVHSVKCHKRPLAINIVVVKQPKLLIKHFLNDHDRSQAPYAISYLPLYDYFISIPLHPSLLVFSLDVITRFVASNCQFA